MNYSKECNVRNMAGGGHRRNELPEDEKIKDVASQMPLDQGK